MAAGEIVLSNAKNYIGRLPKRKLYFYLFVFVAVVGASIVGLSFINRENYAVLFSGLSMEDASAVVSKLKELKVPYRLAMNGTTIYVPKDKVYEVRLLLASSNALPGGGGQGFELFDKTNYGMTEFLQNVNYKRAIQGELQRTINQMPEIKGSRVHIAIPEKTLFKEKEEEVTASVFLKVREGRTLSKEQIMSIVYLVSGSVEGLKPENVIIVDSNGRTLYKKDVSTNFALTSQQLELQREVERKIETSIQDMLNKFIPSGKSIVKANVELNFRKVEETREEYIPEKTVVTSEKKTREKSMNRNREEKGTPGVASNLEKKGEGETGTSSTSQTEREDTQIAYEVSKVIKRIVEPVGEIKRLSIAVLVDGKYEKVKGDKGEELKYIPRSPKEIEDIKNLVARACGFDEARGDRIEVLNMPFETEPFVDESPIIEKMEKREFYLSIAKYGFYFLITFAFFFFFLRPLMKLLTAKRETYHIKDVYVREKEERAVTERKIESLPDALKNKELVTGIIKEWVKEGT